MSRLDLLPTQPDRAASTALHGWRLLLARLLWLSTSALILLLVVLIIPLGTRWLLLDQNIADSLLLITLRTDIRYSQFIGYVLFLRYLVSGFYALVALLIAWRKSNEWLGLLTSLVLLGLPYIVFFGGALYDLNYPFPINWRIWTEIAEGWVMAVVLSSLLWLLFIFPDGSFEPRPLQRTVQGMFVAFFVGMAFVNEYISTYFPGWLNAFLYDNSWYLFSTLALILFLLGAGGQVYRYLRISTSSQRQQTRWIVFSLLVNLGMFLVFASGVSTPEMRAFSSAAYLALLELHASLAVLALLPLSLAIAVLRFHLWDIDLIIRRTLVYSLLSGLLALIYYSGVLLLQGVLTLVIANLGPVIGDYYSGMLVQGARTSDYSLTAVTNPQPPAFVVVLSTLAIAALFNPLRRRVQDFIDRRFYRQKYDAEKALSAFAEAARSETELEALTTHLTATVQETLQPEQVDLWLSRHK